MMDLKRVAEQAFDEAEGAEVYIREAIAHKKVLPGVAAMYADMGAQELSHALKLCDIGETIAKTSDDPDMYSKIWDWFRDMLTAKFTNIRRLQDTYKT